MSVTINAKGTSVSSFTVGKNGTNISQSGTISPPSASDLVVSTTAGKGLVVTAATGASVITSGTNKDLSISANGTGVLSLQGSTWPTGLGTDGYVLSTNGAGVLSWVAVSGGSGYLPLTGGTLTGDLAITSTTGALELGRIDGTSSSPRIDFHSGATAVDYDARISTSGGTGSNAGGTLTISSTHLYIPKSLVISDVAGTNRGSTFQTSGSSRWFVGVSSAAEAGSDAGSNYFIARYSDAGAYIDNPLGITRSTGLVTVGSAGLTTSGTITAGAFSGSGASLTALNASNISTGTVATARMGSGTANSVTYLRGDNTWDVPPTGFAWTKKTAAYTAVAGDMILTDTSGGAFTITLPASPVTGNSVKFADLADWSAINLTVGRNGSTIEGAAEDLVMNIKGIEVELIYSGTTWEVFAYVGPAELPAQAGHSGKFLTTNGVTPQWSSPGSATITNDTTTNSNLYYPTMAFNTTTGSLSDAYVSASKLYFNPGTGTLNATVFNSLSDIKYKENIKSLGSALDIVNSIRPVEFTWKDNGNTSYGVIAQEIEKILPAIVETGPDAKSVSYTQIIPFLLKAIQELHKEIQILKGGK